MSVQRYQYLKHVKLAKWQGLTYRQRQVFVHYVWGFVRVKFKCVYAHEKMGTWVEEYEYEIKCEWVSV